MADGPVLHSISIAEFEKTLGNTLVVKYPDFKLEEYDDQYLANCCLPDRAHLVDEDWTYLILPMKNKKTQQPYFLYGMGYFRNFRDATVRRGAVQKSLLLLSSQPYFSVYRPLLAACIEKYYKDSKDGKDTAKADSILKALYETVNHHLTQKILPIHLWGESYAVNIPVLGEDQFEGASLVDLVGRFNVDTMLLWYGLLTGLRILFSGQPAHAVGNCCVAAPLLVAPLHGFSSYITPYVALTDIQPIQRKPYICGTTNLLFETKTEWYDMMGSFSTGSVHCSQSSNAIKVGGAAREFIKNVISGIQDNKGEQWVRQQFYNYTKQFLDSVEGEMSKDHKKWLSNFGQSELYHKYKANLKNAKPTEVIQNPLETFYVVQKSMNDPESIDHLKRTKLLFDLTKTLEDLTTIGQVCDNDGVAVISHGLSSNSSQVRKYSAMVLSNLALSVQGQIAILSEAILPRVIELLKDEMPNVQSAACYCLYKISTLYIGAQALVASGVQNALADLVGSEGENLNLKREAASALLQMYRYSPTAPKPPGIIKSVHNQLQYQRDKMYTSTLLQLLDVWNEGLPLLEISEKIKTPISLLSAKKGEQLTDEDIEIRTEASTYLLSEIVREPVLLFEFVEAGGVERLLENEEINLDHLDNEKLLKLKRISYSLVAPLTDSAFGRRKVMRYRVVERALEALERTKEPLCLFAIARFLEVCCQHSDTTNFLIECGGVNILVKFVLTHFQETDTNLLCIPVLGALRYLLLLNPSIRESVNSEDKLSPLRTSFNVKSGNTRLLELTASIFSILDKQKQN